MNENPEKSGQTTFPENLKKAGKTVWEYISPLLEYFKEVILYYVKNFSSMKTFIFEFFPALQSGKDIRREIRISNDTNSENVRKTSKGFEITLPDCCVVSGEETENSAETEEFRVENFGIPLGILLVFFVVSLFISAIYLNFWILLLGTLAGMIVGYMNRKFVDVKLTFKKSDAFRDRNFPTVRFFQNELIVKVGHKIVRQKFTSKDYQSPLESSEREYVTPPSNSDIPNINPTVPSSEAESAPKSIPLHDVEEGSDESGEHDEDTDKPIVPEDPGS